MHSNSDAAPPMSPSRHRPASVTPLPVVGSSLVDASACHGDGTTFSPPKASALDAGSPFDAMVTSPIASPRQHYQHVERSSSAPMSSLSSSSDGAATAACAVEEDKRVKLNVGGKKFVTTRSTIFSRGENFLTLLISKHDLPEYFVDRSPQYFAVVLELLRTGRLFKPAHLNQRQLELELDFYQISPSPSSLVPLPLIGERPAAVSSSAHGLHCSGSGHFIEPLHSPGAAPSSSSSSSSSASSVLPSPSSSSSSSSSRHRRRSGTSELSASAAIVPSGGGLATGGVGSPPHGRKIGAQRLSGLSAEQSTTMVMNGQQERERERARTSSPERARSPHKPSSRRSSRKKSKSRVKERPSDAVSVSPPPPEMLSSVDRNQLRSPSPPPVFESLEHLDLSSTRGAFSSRPSPEALSDGLLLSPSEDDEHEYLLAAADEAGDEHHHHHVDESEFSDICMASFLKQLLEEKAKWRDAAESWIKSAQPSLFRFWLASVHSGRVQCTLNFSRPKGYKGLPFKCADLPDVPLPFDSAFSELWRLHFVDYHKKHFLIDAAVERFSYAGSSGWRMRFDLSELLELQSDPTQSSSYVSSQTDTGVKYRFTEETLPLGARGLLHYPS